MAVTCPQGMGAGSQVQIKGPSGALFAVAIPAGVGPGQQFHVQASSLPPPPSPPRDAVLRFNGNAQVPSAAAPQPVMATQMQQPQMMQQQQPMMMQQQQQMGMMQQPMMMQQQP